MEICNNYSPTIHCVTGNNIQKLTNSTLKECQYTCSHTNGCLGIEYYRKSDAANRNDVYEEFDCNLSSSTDITDCDADKWQMYLWVKEDPVECKIWKE